MLSADQLEQLLLATFADQAREQLRVIDERLRALETAETPCRDPLIEDVLREAHSLKGAARAVELRAVEAAAHELESFLGAMQKGELEPNMTLAEDALGALHARVQEGLAGSRAAGAEECRPQTLPVSTVFDALARMARELARELGKELELTVEGGDLMLDSHLLDRLRSPLTHIVRNSVDHGIEHPRAREAAGKDRRGRVALSASIHAGELVICGSDDGAGIDVEQVRDRAVETERVTEECARGMSERDALRLIFRSGVSTRREVTSISGRGVGLDVVREQVERLHGRIDVSSTAGQGTSFALMVPLSPPRSNSRPGG